MTKGLFDNEFSRGDEVYVREDARHFPDGSFTDTSVPSKFRGQRAFVVNDPYPVYAWIWISSTADGKVEEFVRVTDILSLSDWEEKNNNA